MASKTNDSDIEELCSRLSNISASTGLKDYRKFQSSASKKFVTTYLGKYKGLTANDIDAGVMGKLYLDEKAKTGTAAKYFTITPSSVDKYIGLCAFEYAKKKKPAVKSVKDPEVDKIKQDMINTVVNTEVEETQVVADSAVVGRLTDTSKYTGAHKERFDSKTGKGLGIAGRKDQKDTSGYVQGYKGDRK